MKYFFAAVVFCACSHLAAHAQTSDTILEKTVRPIIRQARFPGGISAWQSYLAEHVNTSVATKNKAPKGSYSVQASFVVDKQGKITEVEILKDPGFGTGADFKSVLENAPQWIPATQDGKPVACKQKQSIIYKVE